MAVLKHVTSVGDKYGQFTVLVSEGNRSFCRCVCGSELWIYNKNLMTRHNPKCRACFAKMGAYPHRVSHAVWNAIRRCTQPTHKRYADWGGRGIRCFEKWVLEPYQFCKYLMTLPGWDNPALVLDRIDNDGHYEPGNLRWVTRSESQKNRRRAISRSDKHRASISAAKRGVPWTPQRRAAYLRSHYRRSI